LWGGRTCRHWRVSPEGKWRQCDKSLPVTVWCDVLLLTLSCIIRRAGPTAWNPRSALSKAKLPFSPHPHPLTDSHQILHTWLRPPYLHIWQCRNFALYTTENMLPNDNVSMSVRHFDHVLIVYSSMEHVTWKSPGPMCGWVGRILHPDSCILIQSASFIHLSVDHFCLVRVDDMVLFHGMVCDGWLVSYTALPCPGCSGLCTSCERAPSSCKQSRRDQDVRRTSKRCH